MKRKIFITFIVLTIVKLMYGSEYIGIKGANFLKIGTSPKVESMGSSYVSILDGIHSIQYNPGGVQNITNINFSFSTVDWVDNVGVNYASFAMPYKKLQGNIFASLMFLYISPITYYNDWGEDIGKMDFINFSLSGGYSRIFQGYYVGANLKILYERIYTENNFGIALDIGGIYKFKPFKYKLANKFQIKPDDLTIGVSVKNLGTKAGSDNLPLEIDFGSSVSIIRDLKFSLTIVKPIYVWSSFIDFDYKANLGFEYALMNTIYLRTGIKLFYDIPNNFTIGFGVVTDFFNGKLFVDYAYAAYTYLEKTNRLSITLKIKKWRFWERNGFSKKKHL